MNSQYIDCKLELIFFQHAPFIGTLLKRYKRNYVQYEIRNYMIVGIHLKNPSDDE